MARISRNPARCGFALAATVMAISSPLVAGASTFHSELSPCPAACGGRGPIDWTTYHQVDRLAQCNQTMLLDFAVHNPLEDPRTDVTIRACTADEDGPRVAHVALDLSMVPGGNVTNDEDPAEEASSACQAAKSTKAIMQLAWTGSGKSANGPKIIEAAEHVQSYLKKAKDCATTIIFGYSEGAVVGAYAGPMMQKSGAADTMVKNFITHLGQEGVGNSKLVQFCGPSADYMMGIVAGTTLESLQKVVKSWSKGQCVTGYERTADWKDSDVWVSGGLKSQLPTNSTLGSATPSGKGDTIQRRADCRTVQVAAGDGCASLATKCGISGADFTKYNPSSTLCSSLKPGQHVCCSAGTLPDLTPKPNADGSCFTYSVQAGDWCDKIAGTYGLAVDRIEWFNKNTWGWMGCVNLQPGASICLSAGAPPMPAPIANAVCGPQKPGTKKPASGIKLADLNPCPLNVCCNVWGQCGTTGQFCKVSKSPTGAPGTSAPGENGCISNCGEEIVNNGSPPSEFISIAYFEAWNFDRPCLTMDVTKIDKSKFTHIHFAFAIITPDFQVKVDDVQEQFDKFKDMSGIKRILSFGGWSFSTELDSYPIFRDSVTEANRKKFANNVVNFMKEHNLDGLDFDWEYPSAPDIPGIPAGSPNEGPNYLQFLKDVKAIMPEGKSLAIAAPASYWYLKGFPINEMGKVLDYIVYMTYDLHGQWDYGSQWGSPGCTSGNCLRSHVNLTETMNALAMVTKAGVPASKIIVGVTSYGRSFQMAQAGCSGPNCLFTGPESGATPGECTETAGYISNAEIDSIIEQGFEPQYDQGSDSIILVYDDVQWVAYMDGNTKISRTAHYKSLNFGGVTDWAVDLWEYTSIFDDVEYQACDRSFNNIDDLAKESDIPSHCINQYLIAVESKTLDWSLETYTDIIEDGYDGKFETYARYIKQLVPMQLRAYMKDNANTYFTCKFERQITCCKDCSSAQACQGGCVNTSPCTTGRFWVDEPCPNYTPNPTRQSDAAPNAKFELKDEDGFFNDLMEKYGIDKSWVVFGDWRVYIHGGCWGSSGPCTSHHYWQGFPLASDFEVPNPKDVIGEALDNLKSLNNDLKDTSVNVNSWLWGGDMSDVVDGASIPVYLADNAVKSMQTVVDKAEEIEEAELKQMILAFVMSILFLLPAVGTAAADVGLAMLSRVIAVVTEVGHAAVAIYEIVQDPSNWLFAVVGMLMSPRGGGPRNEASFKEAADLRRTLDPKAVGQLGDRVSDSLSKVQNMAKSCI